MHPNAARLLPKGARHRQNQMVRRGASVAAVKKRAARERQEDAEVASSDPTAAERNRRYRARQSGGLAIITLELTRADVEVLFVAGLLDARRDCHERAEIAAAIRAYLRISRDA